MAKAKLKIRGGNLDELEAERNEAEHKRIFFAEAFFVVLFALVQDLIEPAAVISAASGVGIVLAIFLAILWALITFGLIVWMFMRRMHGRAIIRFALFLIGKVFDISLTGGAAPIGTIIMMGIIWLNNRFSAKTIKQIEDILHGHL